MSSSVLFFLGGVERGACGSSTSRSAPGPFVQSSHVQRELTVVPRSAIDVDFSERLLEVSAQGEDNFYVPYDKLVIACGSVNSTHGVPGLENCFQLKTVQDAQAIRRRVMDNLEKAALPSTDMDERKKLLSFVVCGGGPTGVEFASELWEMVNEDVTACASCPLSPLVHASGPPADFAALAHPHPRTDMPQVLRDNLSVHIIQSRDHILNTYAEKISEYAEERFRRNEIDLITNARVKEVQGDKVIYTVKDPKTGKTEQKELDSGFTLWSTGIGASRFSGGVGAPVPSSRVARGRPACALSGSTSLFGAR